MADLLGSLPRNHIGQKLVDEFHWALDLQLLGGHYDFEQDPKIDEQEDVFINGRVSPLQPPFPDLHRLNGDRPSSESCLG